MKRFKLGLNPATYDPKAKWMAKYVNRSTIKLLAKPLDLSIPGASPYSWIMTAMLANGPSPLNPPQIADGVGCCFWAAAVRRAALAGLSVGKVLFKSEADALAAVLKGYASTGFDLNNPSNTDNGTDPTAGFSYLKSTGLLCSDGSYDKIGTAISVNPNDLEELLIAFNFADGLMIGVDFPGSWEDAGVWDVVTDSIEGAHEIPGVSDLNISSDGVIKLDSWGTYRIITAAALAKYCNQMTAIIDPDEFGPDGKSIQGFDAEQLQADVLADAA